jgi:hypothetical protein
MKKISAQMIVTIFTLLTITVPGIGGLLDDYYLHAFSEQSSGSALQKASLFQTTVSGEIALCGTPLKHGLSRDWNQLEATTQKVLAKQLAAPVLSGSEMTLLSSSGRFLIHYTASGVDAVPSISWVQTVAQTFDDVASAYTARGWRLAPTPADAPYDVYLRELSSRQLYGMATSGQAIPAAGFANAYGSYMEIDNNFTDSIYTNANGGPFSATQSLQTTVAHEYHHAIQYGYNYYFDVWYAEAVSTWMEDEIYDGVNQIYNYLPAWFNNSNKALDLKVGSDATTSGAGYSRWIFNRYQAEQHGVDAVRASWEKLAGVARPADGSDIIMLPVLESLMTTTYSGSLGNDVFGFAKRVYTGAWGTGTVSHAQDIHLIPPYTPIATLSSYPADSTSTLDHYSFVFYKYTPTTTVATLSLTLNSTRGIKTTLFKKSGDIVSEIAVNSDGSYTVFGFDSLNAVSDEVVLLLVNTTNVDNLQATFSANGIAAVRVIPGDCNSNGTVTIDEVQSAINMFLGLTTVAACVDTNGDSNVSIAEVQKSINSFLGL